MDLQEAKKIIEHNGGKHMVKADFIFLSDYEKSSPFWKRILLALEIVESNKND